VLNEYNKPALAHVVKEEIFLLFFQMVRVHGVAQRTYSWANGISTILRLLELVILVKLVEFRPVVRVT